MEPEPALERLFSEHPRAAHKATVAALREAGAVDLAARVAALRAERAQAADEEAWRAADAAGTGIGPDGPAPLAALEAAIPREVDAERRRGLARAAEAALAPAASRREAAAETRARARAEVGLAPDWRLVVEGDQALAASDDAYRDVLGFLARRVLGGAPATGLVRADLLRIAAAPEWDGLFRPGMLAVAMKLTLEPLGLDAGKVRVDDAPRPAKWPGAHTFGARVSLRPRGGGGDWQDLLAALARATAAAARPPHARDAIFGEALAWLLGSLVLERRWLAERADVDARHAADVVRALAFRRLVALRADGAALRVATEVERGLSGAAWREAHRSALTAATGAAWDGARASRDADADRLAVAVAGAAAGERLRAAVRDRLDEDWWRNPRAKGFLAGLLAAGRLPEEEGGPAPGAAAAEALSARLEGR
jgi:hypothetical protein